MIHHVFANKSNIGDWLSARAIQSLSGFAPVREHFCDEAFVAETLAKLADAGPNDLIVIGGGGLFMDYFLPFWEGFDEISRRVPLCIWGVGYCDSKHRASRPPLELLKRIVQRSRLCIVRDELTRQHLHVADLPPPVPCPSIVALQPAPQKKRALLHSVHYETTGEAGYERMCDLVRELAQRSGREYLETNNEIRAGSEQSLSTVLKLYDDADVVISTRLHGCIIGLSMGCKVLAVSGDRKIDAFMTSAGLREWVCEVGDEKQLRLLMDRLEDQPAPTAFLDEVRRQNQSVARRVVAIAKEVGAV